MRLTKRRIGAALAAAALLTLSACGGSDNASGDGHKVEVFTWWADGGEKAGLDALVQLVRDRLHPDDKFVNGAVAGGAGANAKQVLASDLQTNNPPDTFQAHAGAELTRLHQRRPGRGPQRRCTRTGG